MKLNSHGNFYREMIRKAKAEEMLLALTVLEGGDVTFSGNPGYFSVVDGEKKFAASILPDQVIRNPHEITGAFPS